MSADTATQQPPTAPSREGAAREAEIIMVEAFYPPVALKHHGISIPSRPPEPEQTPARRAFNNLCQAEWEIEAALAALSRPEAIAHRHTRKRLRALLQALRDQSGLLLI